MKLNNASIFQASIWCFGAQNQYAIIHGNYSLESIVLFLKCNEISWSVKFRDFSTKYWWNVSDIYDLRPCTRRARLGGRTALGRKRSYQNGWLPEEKKLKHNVVWENLLFVHILTFSVRFSTNDRISEFSALSTQLIGDASHWKSASTTKSCFASEKPKLEVIVSVLHTSWLRGSATAKRVVCVF